MIFFSSCIFETFDCKFCSLQHFIYTRTRQFCFFCLSDIYKIISGYNILQGKLSHMYDLIINRPNSELGKYRKREADSPPNSCLYLQDNNCNGNFFPSNSLIVFYPTLMITSPTFVKSLASQLGFAIEFLLVLLLNVEACAPVTWLRLPTCFQMALYFYKFMFIIFSSWLRCTGLVVFFFNSMNTVL